MTLEQLYEHYSKPGPYTVDIIEHLETLRNLSADCSHVTEMGFRYGTSFAALLMGKPKTAITYDLQIPAEPMAMLYMAAKKAGIVAVFNEQSTLDAIIEDTDLLFIDTLHTYKQLKEELKLHGHKAKKYLVFHDTQTFGEKGEDGSTPGLRAAIDEYMKEHKEWTVLADRKNNNGLLILRRVELGSYAKKG